MFLGTELSIVNCLSVFCLSVTGFFYKKSFSIFLDQFKFIYLITLRTISQGERSQIVPAYFEEFFRVCSVRNCQPAFYLSVTAFCKKFFWFSLTNPKFSANVCSLLGFPSVEIKSDDGYQVGRRIFPDIHRPILYHVISFIQ